MCFTNGYLNFLRQLQLGIRPTNISETCFCYKNWLNHIAIIHISSNLRQQNWKRNFSFYSSCLLQHVDALFCRYRMGQKQVTGIQAMPQSPSRAHNCVTLFIP